MTYIKENKEAWNRHSERYTRSVNFSYENVDYGNPYCVNDSDLKLIGNVEDKKILELGCGGANCGIALAKKNGKVTCRDLSEQQLSWAKIKAQEEQVNIKFDCGAIEDLSDYEEESFDLVISMCAFQYVEDINKVFREASRILKTGGRIIFSTDDPIFYSVGIRELWHEDQNDPSYFYRGEYRWKWEDEDDFYFTTFRRPIEDYINGLIDQGFILERFHEISPKYDEIASKTDELETIYPTIMIFKAQKQNSIGTGEIE